MKIRSGFVSNSSSSSFVLFGVKIGKKLDKDLEVKIMEAFGYNWKKEVENLDERVNEDDDDDGKLDLDESLDGDTHEVFLEFLYNYLEPKKKLVVIYHREQGSPKNFVYMGKRITTNHDTGMMEDSQIKFDEIEEIVNNINKVMKTKHKGEVIIGTTIC